ncbi:MAG: DUF6498-containing protein [Candidatus Eisenbacteria bacterium]
MTGEGAGRRARVAAEARGRPSLAEAIAGDRSVVPLVGANLLTLVLAVAGGWPLASLMGIYWAQSVMIGFFNVFKILDLRNFTTSGLMQGGRPVPATRASQISTAAFFAVHYGFFHLVYFIVVGGQMGRAGVMDRTFALCVVAFFANHLYSYLHNREGDRERRQNLGTVMFFPYARILPMHLMIVTGVFLVKGPAGIAVFLLLKTAADVLMHGAEHRAGAGNDRPRLPG